MLITSQCQCVATSVLRVIELLKIQYKTSVNVTFNVAVTVVLEWFLLLASGGSVVSKDDSIYAVPTASKGGEKVQFFVCYAESFDSGIELSGKKVSFPVNFSSLHFSFKINSQLYSAFCKQTTIHNMNRSTILLQKGPCLEDLKN